LLSKIFLFHIDHLSLQMSSKLSFFKIDVTKMMCWFKTQRFVDMMCPLHLSHPFKPFLPKFQNPNSILIPTIDSIYQLNGFKRNNYLNSGADIIGSFISSGKRDSDKTPYCCYQKQCVICTIRKTVPNKGCKLWGSRLDGKM